MARHALCIGINDYPGTKSDLHGCVNDANDWKDALAARDFEVTMLLDREATGAGMRKAMKAIVTGASPGDEVFITYSGHGSFIPDNDGDEPDGTDECLCPHDIGRNGPITDDELFDMFQNREQGVRLVMVSDSCHSGSVAKFAPSSTPAASREASQQRRLVRFLPPSIFLSKEDEALLGTRRARRVASPPGRYAALLLAGCQDTEVSYDAYFSGRANGAFTFVALEELQKLSATSTFRDWYVRIRKRLPTQQYPQSPALFGSESMKQWRVFGEGANATRNQQREHATATRSR